MPGVKTAIHWSGILLESERDKSETRRAALGVPLQYAANAKKAIRHIVSDRFGAPSGARTRDTLIKSQVLYQLS